MTFFSSFDEFLSFGWFTVSLKGLFKFLRHFIKFEMHFSTPPCPLFLKEGGALPTPIWPISFHPKVFRCLFSGEKNMHCIFLLNPMIFGFWNLIKHASIWVQWGRRKEGEGCVKPRDVAHTHTSQIWLEQNSYLPHRYCYATKRFPLAKKCTLLILYNPYYVNILYFSVLLLLKISFKSFWSEIFQSILHCFCFHLTGR